MKKKCRSLLSFTVLVLKMLQRYILRIPPSISTFTDIDVVKKVFLGFLAKRNCSPFLYSPSVPVHSPYWCRNGAFGNVNSQSSSMYTGFVPRSLLLDHLGPPLPTSSFVIPITALIQSHRLFNTFSAPRKPGCFRFLHLCTCSSPILTGSHYRSGCWDQQQHPLGNLLEMQIFRSHPDLLN